MRLVLCIDGYHRVMRVECGGSRDDLAPDNSGQVPHDCAGIVPYATVLGSC